MMLWTAFALAASPTLHLEGLPPTTGFLDVPFDVPAGTAQISLVHNNGTEANVLDWGVVRPDGTERGWGGGNTEPVWFHATGASRSYATGPIEAGAWAVRIGAAKVVDAQASWSVDLTLHPTVVAPEQPERQPYQPATLRTGAAWYAGDLHAHSRESGDAAPTLDEMATYARARGLDFLVITDHNVLTGQDFFVDAQTRHPELLFLPGMEWTTYEGHANAFDLTTWVPHTTGRDGFTADDAVRAIRDAGALVSINHPALDLGDTCIGCAWSHPLSDAPDAVEICTGSVDRAGGLFVDAAIATWEDWSATGARVAAVGGSDDHQGGTDSDALSSPLSEPTTRIWADALSPAALRDGLARGRTVVQLGGPEDPMADILTSGGQGVIGSEVAANAGPLTGRITGGGEAAVWVVDGIAGPPIPITSDPAEVRWELSASNPPHRVRLEVWSGGKRRTLTSHVWIRPAAPATPDATQGCATAPAAPFAAAVAAAVTLRRRPTRLPLRPSGGCGTPRGDWSLAHPGCRPSAADASRRSPAPPAGPQRCRS
jgi:hypothetical protein